MSSKLTKVRIFTKNEVLLNNTLQKDFQNYLKPLHFLQYFYASPKFLMSDNFITPIGKWLNLLCFVATSAFLILIITWCVAVNVVSSYLALTGKQAQETFRMLRLISFAVNLTGHLINVFSNYYHSTNNVSLILKIQDTLNKLPHKRSLSNETFWNYVYGIVVVIHFYSFYGYLDCFHIKKCHLLEITSDYTMIGLYVNTFYSTRIMVMIHKNIITWMGAIKNVKGKNRRMGAKYWKRMFEVYSIILESYQLFSKVFQEVFFHFILDTFFHALLYVKAGLTNTQSNEAQTDTNFNYVLSESLILIIYWVISHLIYISLLALKVEKFYIATEDTAALSAKYLGDPSCDEHERQFFKKILRLNSSSFTRVRLLQLFQVDVTLTLQLAQVTANNTIVILQFFFTD